MAESEEGGGMKSAYELAMERLEGSQQNLKHLDDEAKAAVNEVSSEVRSKIAELEIMTSAKIAAAQGKGEFGEIEALNNELQRERARIEEDGEARKKRIWEK